MGSGAGGGLLIEELTKEEDRKGPWTGWSRAEAAEVVRVTLWLHSTTKISWAM